MHPGSIPGEASTTARHVCFPDPRGSRTVPRLLRAFHVDALLLGNISTDNAFGGAGVRTPLRRGGKKRHRSPLPPPGSGVCHLRVSEQNEKIRSSWNKEAGCAFVAIAGPRHPPCAVLRGCSQPSLYSETEQLAAGTNPPHFSFLAGPRRMPFGTIPVRDHSSPEPAKEKTMNQLIYLVGLVVVVIAILSFFGFA